MKIFNTIVKIAVFSVIIVMIGLLGYALFGERGGGRTSPLVGREAPDFTLKLFDGQKLSLKELRGKTVLVNFWASWCAPCREEAGALEESWERYKDKDVVFIGVNVWDENSNALSYMERFGGAYPHGMDPEEEIQVNYGIGGVPETYFIDSSGVIRDKYNGPLTNEIIDHFLTRAVNPEDGNS